MVNLKSRLKLIWNRDEAEVELLIDSYQKSVDQYNKLFVKWKEKKDDELFSESLYDLMGALYEKARQSLFLISKKTYLGNVLRSSKYVYGDTSITKYPALLLRHSKKSINDAKLLVQATYYRGIKSGILNRHYSPRLASEARGSHLGKVMFGIRDRIELALESKENDLIDSFGFFDMVMIYSSLWAGLPRFGTMSISTNTELVDVYLESFDPEFGSRTRHEMILPIAGLLKFYELI